MNKEAVIKLLSEPDELNKVSIEQLEELVEKFPYFHQLHGLIYSKKQLIETPSSPENLTKDELDENVQSDQHNEIEDEENYDDKDEFGALEEEDRDLPFHDVSLKFKKGNHLPVEVIKLKAQPEEIVEEDIAYLLKKAGLSNSNSSDDLTLISFVENETQVLLNKSGLYTYSQLAKLDECREIELLVKLTGKSSDEVLYWKEDSAILFQNKYHRLLTEKVGMAGNNDRCNLQKINGIGTIIESKLNEIGILTFQQLALLEKADIDVLTELIDYFPGRIERDEWVSQAKLKLTEQTASNKNIEENHFDNNEIARLKAKVEAHKNLKRGIGVVSNSKTTDQNKPQLVEQPRESFRDWLAKMNHTSNTKDEKKNLLVNDLTNQPPF